MAGPRRDCRRLQRASCVAALVLAGTALCIGAARAVPSANATWLASPSSNDFDTAGNWTPATVPTGTALFGTSNQTNLTFSTNTTLGGWTFNTGASAYTFTNNQLQTFTGAGIILNGGSATITNNLGLIFANSSTAGSASITNNAGAGISFTDTSTAGSASITNNSTLQFINNSTAGSATITNNAGEMVDFSYSNGPAGNS
jgi:hypothetical protein